jgi:hypothetical protein
VLSGLLLETLSETLKFERNQKKGAKSRKVGEKRLPSQGEKGAGPRTLRIPGLGRQMP